MHVKMFDIPDCVSTRDLLSGFADDKLHSRLQTAKDRNSFRVAEEERGSSGTTGILSNCWYFVLRKFWPQWKFPCFCPSRRRFITLETFPIRATESDGARLCNDVTHQFIPASVKGQSVDSKSVGSSKDLLLPQLSLLCLSLRRHENFVFYGFFFFFISDDKETFPFQKTTHNFHQLWWSLRTFSGYNFTIISRKVLWNGKIIPKRSTPEAIPKLQFRMKEPGCHCLLHWLEVSIILDSQIDLLAW